MPPSGRFIYLQDTAQKEQVYVANYQPDNHVGRILKLAKQNDPAYLRGKTWIQACSQETVVDAAG